MTAHAARKVHREHRDSQQRGTKPLRFPLPQSAQIHLLGTDVVNGLSPIQMRLFLIGSPVRTASKRRCDFVTILFLAQATGLDLR
jgi:hypothetical protein